MSLHRITAGTGYDYLTRQVAAMDSTEKGHTGLASYYTEKGEVPGRWVGSGMAGIDGLDTGDLVNAQQMLALFGSGHHPLAAQRQRDLAGPALTEKDYVEITRLGEPYRVYAGDISPFRVEVARRLEALNKARGLPQKAAAAIEDRARIRSQVTLEMFRTEFGRDPLNERELAGHVARLSRQQTTAVAGFDLTFSPVKSVSALWALAESGLAARIERCHQQAVADALEFIEQHALFTRTGTDGVRQIDVRGLIGTAFTHRDSRAGDPDLHTHVAVANKVQTLSDGRWLSIDSRVLHKAVVAASETYNTALERHLAEAIGVRFEAREDTDPRKRPIREIVGMDAALNHRWSTRRQSIEARWRVLAAAFQADHGRPPTPVEAIALAQQATLETREAKHEPRSLAEQRTTWWRQAREVLGGENGIRTMIHAALHPAPGERHIPNQAWLEHEARRVVAIVQRDRSTWQTWHLRSEALRSVRAVEVPSKHVHTVVNLLLDQALTSCVALTRPVPGEPQEPAPLRRRDGASVYTVAGSQLYTSNAILAAEARLVASAGGRDGWVVPTPALDKALLESRANGVELNPGQVLMVREMATSGARVQLAIAPAGSGKTTAMNALSRAWSQAGGTAIGLAPSAAAAAALGENIDGYSDTLAKLVWSLRNGETPDWADQIGPRTLVIIDEAGMADTLSLDTVVRHVLERGGSVRLIGDDQQLAAIGAGGVLRDIQATHGALRLTELVRFADRAEGSASLALREGHTSALGFYLDQRRIHVGDATTMADDLFASWTADRAGGLDSIMLAPTRELVADLNQRARTQRLADTQPGREIELADGNHASVGDTIITRTNNRKLRVSPTDWVKNGDRWSILDVDPRRGLHVRHTQSGRRVQLPADYVAESVELGYATTIHTAQGVTADTMHGMLAGNESRQQAYTMLTRGREANHAYVVVVGDGDPHTLIHPETINPLTPTDILERILARDESPISATTALRDAANPARQLGEATSRYTDAVTFATARLVGEDGISALEQAVDEVAPGLINSPTWPALRAQLLTVQADDRDAIQAFRRARIIPLTDTQDPCSTLAGRIADTGRHYRGGPLPWLPRIPDSLTREPLWGDYLNARQQLVRDLAGQVRDDAMAAETRPAWLAGTGRAASELVADIEVWRAARQVEPGDTRPTGARRGGLSEPRWQAHLDRRLASTATAAMDDWRPLLEQVSPLVLADGFAPTLAARLSQLSSAGINVPGLLRAAGAQGPLPDDHAAAAIWWRLSGHLTPAVAEAVDTDHHLATQWLPTFTERLGDTSRQLQDSPWWPALVTTIERGLQRGWPLDQLLDETRGVSDDDGRTDPCQVWVWRLSLLTDAHDLADEDRYDPADEPPDDVTHGWTPSQTGGPANSRAAAIREPDEVEFGELDDDQILKLEGLIRAGMGAPEPTEARIRHQLERRDQITASPVPVDRLARINELTTAYYQACLPNSWATRYLDQRLHADPATLEPLRLGYAPDSWTGLITHLRRIGVTDGEMLTAGVATTASTGRLIDRFRDRLVVPIVHDHQVLGFVARRNPHFGDDDGHGPKYLNTAATPLFAKADQLFIAGDLTADATPVLVEGPLDAIAVTLTGDGRHIGVAPLGTSLTEAQVAQLHEHGRAPVVATDADLAGKVAAERDYWLLTLYNLDPTHAILPDGADPADLLAIGDAAGLAEAITNARPLADSLIDERLDHLEGAEAALDAVCVLAAQPAGRWIAGTEHIADRTGLPSALLRSALASMVKARNADPRKATQAATDQIAETKERLATRSQQRAVEVFERVETPTHRNQSEPLPTFDPPDQHGISW
ncbi:MAG: relaxase domain-containing protein [Propionibacteriaceae bacterium]|nr:relaxase domain-containing protein [Propionibacteriaceae bacterium]